MDSSLLAELRHDVATLIEINILDARPHAEKVLRKMLAYLEALDRRLKELEDASKTALGDGRRR